MRAGIATRGAPVLSIAGLAVAILAALLALFLVRAQARSNEWVQHALQVQLRLNHVSEMIRTIESDTRGYMLTHEQAMRSSTVQTGERLDAALDELSWEVRDNPVQIANLARLRSLIAQRLTFARVSAARYDGGRMIPTDLAVRGPRLMAMVTGQIEKMAGTERGLLAQRRAETDRLVYGLGASLVLTVLLVLAVAGTILRDARRREVELTAARDVAVAAERAIREQIERLAAAEDQIRQMQKMESIGQLTGGIAHDFNNMLAIVIGSLDLARRRLDGDPERLKRCINNAYEGAERAAALTARLLAFSRQTPLAPITLDINKLVAGMSELLRRTMGEQYMVETVLSGGLWRAFVDPGQLENALVNLSVNARDAMAEGGRVTIETANAYLDDEYARDRAEVTPGQYVMISVSDTGTGMTPEVIARAFDPFFTTKPLGKGTGLGLSQIYGFAKQTGGHIAIYSEPGQGTTVKLYLPRHMGEAVEPRTSRPPESVLPTAQPGEVILVVEDEQRVRHFSVDALRELGYVVISAENGFEALKAIDSQPQITMLFTDIVMPDMNGRKLADAATEKRPDLKVLYTTGYTRNAVVHNGMLDAGVAFLPKPFSVTQLAIKVREVMDGAGANRPA
jgi:signal transduction histidine kinase/CheY-like chemotaxis protein